MTKELTETGVELYRHTIHDRRNKCHVAGSASAGIVGAVADPGIPNTIDSKIIIHNYISYWGDPSYVGIFPVDLGMPLIFTDFQQSTCLRPTSCWKICEYQRHP